LHLGHSRVTDAGLSHLKGLTKLQILKLQQTSISDAGLAALRPLTALQCLDLEGTDVSDAGLTQLAGMRDLRILFLGGTRVSEAGIRKLQAAHPSVQIFNKPAQPLEPSSQRPGAEEGRLAAGFAPEVVGIAG
jgi:hypothetical protein